MGAVTKKTSAIVTGEKTAADTTAAVNTNGNPYRPGSAYSTTFSCLHNLSQKHEVVSRGDVLAEVVKVSGKEEKLAKYDLAVVLSPRKDGSSHRSAKKACDTYYIEPLENGMVRLVMREKTNEKTN